jgi:hypothetical protein
MKYSKRQIEVWEARARLDEKLLRMTPDEIDKHAQQAAEEWRRKMEAKTRPAKRPRPARTSKG